ncbi:MAG: hypothetical protein ACLP8B_12715 [Xanthobacteraceae bacterium]
MEEVAAMYHELRKAGTSAERIAMKPFVVALAWLALCGLAQAEGPDCKAILRAADRLACYDKAFPPVPAEKPKSSGTMKKLLDSAADEEAKLKKSLQSICSHC